ncbi:MAG TPA: hypothetical protein VGQ69_02025 [Gemmatimonadales bacterium]|jgi:hypothetical protein|nr:hypothetical protein [Gemmatimonadales bacterium]
MLAASFIATKDEWQTNTHPTVSLQSRAPGGRSQQDNVWLILVSCWLHAGTHSLLLSFPAERSDAQQLHDLHLFFGIALLDAIRGGYWLRILFWLAVAVIFLLADRRRVTKRTS